MTLRRWYELECGTGEGQVMFSIERDGDEQDSKPYLRKQFPLPNGGYFDKRWPIADRESGAKRRLAKIIAERNYRIKDHITSIQGEEYYKITRDEVSTYLQTDPRGACLYIIRPGDVLAGHNVESCYSRGIAVY